MNWADYCSTSEGAEIVGKNPATVWHWCRRYPGLAIKVGGRYRINRAAILNVARGVPLDQAAADVLAGR